MNEIKGESKQRGFKKDEYSFKFLTTWETV
jgi:hypothetical protein